MTFWLNIVSYFHKYFSIPSISIIDIIEMVLIAMLFYYVIIWLKRTSAWTLAKCIIVILVIMLLAYIFNFSTIVWILSKTISVGVIAILIIFQPELRRALEQLGGRFLFRKIVNFNTIGERFSDETLEELLKAVAEMSLSKTGALITIEQSVSLGEYIRTGIELDAKISSQLLENIFVDKSPLHDGAVVIRGEKIVAATCYYPLSSTKNLNKKYGTRHRAALGISEVSDAFTIVVSEETGFVSLTVQGMIIEDITMDELRQRLTFVQNEQPAINWFDRFRKGVKTDEIPEDTSEIHHQ